MANGQSETWPQSSNRRHFPCSLPLGLYIDGVAQLRAYIFATTLQSRNLKKIVVVTIIGSRSRPPRHLVALCCSQLYKIQSFDALFGSSACGCWRLDNWSIEASGMKDPVSPPLFSSDDQTRQGPDRHCVSWPVQCETKDLSLCHIDGFRARAMPFPNRVPSRIRSAEPSKEGWQAIYSSIHTKAHNRLAL